VEKFLEAIAYDGYVFANKAVLARLQGQDKFTVSTRRYVQAKYEAYLLEHKLERGDDNDSLQFIWLDFDRLLILCQGLNIENGRD